MFSNLGIWPVSVWHGFMRLFALCLVVWLVLRQVFWKSLEVGRVPRSVLDSRDPRVSWLRWAIAGWLHCSQEKCFGFLGHWGQRMENCGSQLLKLFCNSKNLFLFIWNMFCLGERLNEEWWWHVLTFFWKLYIDGIVRHISTYTGKGQVDMSQCDITLVQWWYPAICLVGRIKASQPRVGAASYASCDFLKMKGKARKEHNNNGNQGVLMIFLLGELSEITFKRFWFFSMVPLPSEAPHWDPATWIPPPRVSSK